ncbi:hemagglutinin repeat-containing protein [Camelimonas sp. ID_303_24]
MRSGLLARCFSLTLSTTLSVQPLLVSLAHVSQAQAQVIADPTAPIQFRPGVTASGSGVPAVNIVAPSQGGLSHNRFRDYNVDTRGLILNNSGLGGTSIIGGAVSANPNLVGRRPANVILNEVTGSSKSNLNGPTEVFGARADVIVANPNGVGCASCSFINAGRVTLSTGTPIPNYQTGTVAFDVRRGAVSISGGGVSGPGGQPLAAIDLIGRQLRIDGPVAADGRARLRAGAMRYDQSGDIATALDGAGIGAVAGPAIASSAAGVIRAGAISVLSTDVDLGVALGADVAALGLAQPAPAGGQPQRLPADIVIRSAGDVAIQGSAATGDLHVEAAGRLGLAASGHQAAGGITLAGRDIHIASGAQVRAGGAIVADARDALASRGALASGQSVSLVASGDMQAGGSIAANGRVALEGGAVTTHGFRARGEHVALSGVGAVRLEATTLVSAGDVAVTGRDIALEQGVGFVAPGIITLDATRDLTNGAVLDYPGLRLSIGGTLRNDATGAIVQDSLLFNLSGDLQNAGLLHGRNSVTVNAGNFINAASGTIYGGDIAIGLRGGASNPGKILSERILAIVAQDAVSSDGQMRANDRLTLRAAAFASGQTTALAEAASIDMAVAGAFGNGGRVFGRDQLILTAGALANATDATIVSGAAASLTLAGDLRNSGEIGAVGDLSIAGAHAVNNAGRVIARDGTLRLTAQGAVRSEGAIAARQALLVDATGYHGAGPAARLEGSDLTLRLGQGDFVNLGQAVAENAVAITAGAFDNSGADARIAGATVQLDLAGAAANSGAIASLGAFDLSTTALVNSGSILANGAGALTLGSGAFANNGQARFGGDLTLAASGYEGGAGARLETDGALMATVGGRFGNAGSVQAAGPLTVAATSLGNGAGARLAGQSVSLTVRGDLANAGILGAVDDLTILAAGPVANAGSLLAQNGALVLQADGTVANSGDILGQTGLALVATGYHGAAPAARLGGQTLSVRLGQGDFVNLGQAVAENAVAITAGAFDNSGADARIAGAMVRLDLTGAAANSGAIASLGAFDLATTALVNSGSILANGAGALTLGSGAFTNNGEARFGGDLTLAASGYEGGASARLETDGALMATVGGRFGNAGSVQAAGPLTVAATSLGNGAGARLAGQSASLTVRGDLANAGILGAVDDLTILAAGPVANAGSLLAQNGALVLQADGTVANSGDILGQTGLALVATGYHGAAPAARLGGQTLSVRLGQGDFVNLGQAVAENAVAITAGAFDNSGADARIAGATVRLDLGGAAANSGAIASLGAFDLSTTALVNSGSILANGAGALTLGSGAFANNGEARFGGDLTLAASGYEGGAGARLAGRNLAMTLGGATVNNGDIAAAGVARIVAASLDNRMHGQITAAAGDLTLAGDLLNAGAMRIGDFLGMQAGGQFQNAGSIAAVDIGLQAGGALTNGGRIAASGVFVANGQSLANHAGGHIGGGAIRVGVAGEVQNSGAIRADDALVIQAAQLTNAGRAGQSAALAGGRLSVRLDGPLVNGAHAEIVGRDSAVLKGTTAQLDLFGVNDADQGSFVFGGDLGLDLGGQGLTVPAGKSLVVPGRLALRLGGDVTVAGEIVAGDDLSLISGGSLVVGSVSKPTIDDLFSLWGDPWAKQKLRRMLAASSGALESAGQIFTRGDGAIAVAGDLTNTGSVIEALGSLDVRVGGRIANARTPQRESELPAVAPSMHASDPTKYVDYRTEHAETSPAAAIEAGGDLAVAARAIHNDASVLQAGGVLALQADEVVNASRQTGVTYNTIKVKGDENIGASFASGWWEGTHKESTGLLAGGAGLNASRVGQLTNTGTLTGPAVVIDARVIVNGLTDPTVTTPPPRLPDATIDLAAYAGPAGAGSAFADQPTAVRGAGASFGVAVVAPHDGVPTHRMENASGPSLRRSDTPLHSTLDRAGRSHIAIPAPSPIHSPPGFRQPGATRIGNAVFMYAAPLPALSERNPGWILDQVGDTRNRLDFRFFADPTLERRLIRQALVAQTGRSFLDQRYRNPIRQQEALYEGAVAFLKANPDLRLGQILGEAQRARLTQPILWYVERQINGAPVLAPQLLLPPGQLAEWTKNAGGQISANDIFLSGERIANTGALLATGSLVIDAGDFINMRRVATVGGGPLAQNVLQPGGLAMAGDLGITTRGDLANTGGVLSASGLLTLRAGGDVLVTAQPVSNSFTFAENRRTLTVTSTLNQGALVASGADMSVHAGGSFVVLGSAVLAGGDAGLTASNGVAIVAAMDERAHAGATGKSGLLSGSTVTMFHSEQTQVSSLVSAGGDLTVLSGGDLTVAASGLTAGSSLVAHAAGSASIVSGQDVSTTAASKKKSGVGLFFGDGWMDVYQGKQTTATTAVTRNVAAALIAGGDVAVGAGQDIAVTGSTLAAGGQATLHAGRDIAIASGMERTSAKHTRKVSGYGVGVAAGNGGVSASQGFHYDALRQSREQDAPVASRIQGGDGVAAIGGRDVAITASDIASGGNLMITAAGALSLLAAIGRESTEEEREQAFAGAKLEVSQNVTGALENLKSAATTFRSGHGTAAYEAIGMASGVMRGVDAAMALTNPSVSASLTVGGTHATSSQSAHTETARPATLAAGGGISLQSGADMRLQGAQAGAGRTLALNAGRDLTIESAAAGFGSSQSSSAASFGAGVGVSVGLRSATAGVTANAAVSRSKAEGEGVSHLNARLNAAGEIVIASARDATVAGAVVAAPQISLDIGRNLTVASRQDTGRGKSSSASIGGSITVGAGTSPVSGSLSIGGGQGSSDKAWVSEQTAIIAGEALGIRTQGHTHVDGAVVAARNGNLSLDTGTLAVTNIRDHDTATSRNATVGLNWSQDRSGKSQAMTPAGAPTGAALSGAIANRDREQINRGTIGAGEITIRDPAHQNQAIAVINRDLTRAQKITKDESSGVEFYASDSSVREIASGLSMIRAGMEALGQQAEQALAKLPATVRQLVGDSATRIDAHDRTLQGVADAMVDDLVARGEIPKDKREAVRKVARRAMANPDDPAIAACGQHGFNLRGLVASPAHASAGAIGPACGGLSPQLGQLARGIGVQAVAAVVTTATSAGAAGVVGAAVLFVALVVPTNSDQSDSASGDAVDGSRVTLTGMSSESTREMRVLSADDTELRITFIRGPDGANILAGGTSRETDGTVRDLRVSEIRNLASYYASAVGATVVANDAHDTTRARVGHNGGPPLDDAADQDNTPPDPKGGKPLAVLPVAGHDADHEVVYDATAKGNILAWYGPLNRGPLPIDVANTFRGALQ